MKRARNTGTLKKQACQEVRGTVATEQGLQSKNLRESYEMVI